MPYKRITELQLRDDVSDDLDFASDDGIQSYRVTATQIRAHSVHVDTFTEKVADATPASTDLVMTYDTSATALKKVALVDISNITANITTKTQDSNPASGDSVMTYDTSATAMKKVTLDDISNITTNITGKTADTAPASDDLLLTSDTSASAALKKVTVADLFAITATTTGKTEDTAPAIDDYVVTSDTSASAALKKVQLSNILKIINTLTTDATPLSASDYLVTYDSSASTAKKVLPDTLFGAKSIASGGYITLPGGLIVQWVSAGASTGVTSTNWPITFPNNLWAVFATATNQTGAGAALSTSGSTTSQVHLTTSTGTPSCWALGIGN